MAHPPIPRVRAEWLTISERWQELLCISEPTHWVSHWDTYAKRSRRCGGSACAFCQAGCERQLRVVILAVDGSAREKLVELRERHRYLFDAHDSLVGLRFRIKRSGSARNSPVDVQIVGSGVAVARDIGNLVQTFGLPPVLIGEDGNLGLQPADQSHSRELID